MINYKTPIHKETTLLVQTPNSDTSQEFFTLKGNINPPRRDTTFSPGIVSTPLSSAGRVSGHWRRTLPLVPTTPEITDVRAFPTGVTTTDVATYSVHGCSTVAETSEHSY